VRSSPITTPPGSAHLERLPGQHLGLSRVERLPEPPRVGHKEHEWLFRKEARDADGAVEHAAAVASHVEDDARYLHSNTLGTLGIIHTKTQVECRFSATHILCECSDRGEAAAVLDSLCGEEHLPRVHLAQRVGHLGLALRVELGELEVADLRAGTG